jgi:hypothetical protein
MFWTIVGAILFVSIGIPVIIWVGSILLQIIFSDAGKEIIKVGGIIVIGFIGLVFLWGIISSYNSSSKSYTNTTESAYTLNTECYAKAYQKHIKDWNFNCTLSHAGPKQEGDSSAVNCRLPSLTADNLKIQLKNAQDRCDILYPVTQ